MKDWLSRGGKIAEVHKIQSLKSEGFDDRAILDAVQVIAYFNFVNRLVLGLGITCVKEEMKGYRY